MTNRRTRTLVALVALVTLGVAGLSGAAWAEEQVGIVLDKDVDAKTLTLEGGTVLHVSPQTVIMGLSGQRITFGELPSAVRSNGGWELDGDEGILYEATTRGRKQSADQIQILGNIPD